MSMDWAVCMPVTQAASATGLRLTPGLAVCLSEERFWLRGQGRDEPLDQALRALPCDGRYRVGTDGLLTPQGARVPVGRLPIGPWTPIASWFKPVAPAAVLPGVLPVFGDGHPWGVGLSVAPADREATASVLVTSWPCWLSWAEGCAARLRRLRFALSEDGRAIIHGTPLPPITGRRFVLNEGLAMPAGLRLDPPIDVTVIRGMLEGEPNDLMLFDSDGGYECVPAGNLWPASHSAVRVTEVSRRGG